LLLWLGMDKKDVRVTSPCTLDWRKMTPRDGGRFCGDCKKVVKDLSAMSEREARAVLQSACGGELCVRFIYDQNGRIFFQGDAGALLPAGLLHRARRAAAVAATAVAIPLATQGCEAVTASLDPMAHDQSQALNPQPPGHQDRDPNTTNTTYSELMGGVTADEVNRRMQPDSDAGPDAATGDADAGANDQ
jgi:hypothetical protein